MNMKLTDPKLYLTFEADDLEEGHSTSQTIASDYIVNRSFSGRFQKYNQLKSSSDQISLQIKRKCPSTEDIVATDGNVRAVLKDGEETIYTGYISTTFKWTVTNHGEKALSITIEGVGTRLLNQPFIETGKHYFDCAASAAVYDIVHPLGITIHAGDERKILQSVSRQAEAGDTCRDLLDSLFYECNAVYWFNNLGELCVDKIDPSTVGAETVDSSDLYVVNGEAVSLSKSIRAYKGARITYKALGTSQGYLVYRNTTNATATRICELTLPAGYYFDGAEIYSAAEWAAATADTFREPTLISAVNAASESSIVGSGAIVNISNLSPNVVAPSGVTVTFEAAGGPYFKLTCHNTTGSSQTITRLDLSADIIFEKSDGVIRTQIDGSTAGKSLLEEDLVWIHDKDNAQAHANMVSQYFQYAGATYTFRTKLDISTGTVIKLNEDLYSGLEVYVMIIAREFSAGSEIWKYTAVGISTFDLTESAYHGTTEPAKQSGAQGPAGEPGASSEVQYAIGTSLTDPPGDAMLWGGADMLWASATMNWNTGTWEEDVPEEQRGKYIWMRTRIGDAPWQYTRLTGSASYDPTFLGAVNSLPTQTPDGLDLIPGDYFVASEDFSTYLEGFAYTYNGSTWDIMDLEDVTNAPKALQCLGGILASGAKVTNATYSIWGWFENLVAQNAVIANLVAQYLQVGPGDGTSGSGFRFRALNDDGLSGPVFDVYYGDKNVFTINVTSGDIYFGGGFTYHASTDTIEANDAVFNGITINNANGGEANFGSAVFQQQAVQYDSYTVGATLQGKTLYDAISTTYGYSASPGGPGTAYSQWYPCSAINQSVKYIRQIRQIEVNYGGSYTLNLYGVQFADATKAELTQYRCYRYTTSQTDLNPLTSGSTVKLNYGGNIMKFVGLPTTSTGLASGRVWNDNGTLKIVT